MLYIFYIYKASETHVQETLWDRFFAYVWKRGGLRSLGEKVTSIDKGGF